MTKEEALAKIEELKQYIEDYDGPIGGFKNDKIFLLSINEYKKFEKNINKYCTNVFCWQWLRSPGRYDDYTASVGRGNSIHAIGNYVGSPYVAIRPAFKLSKSTLDINENTKKKLGDCFYFKFKDKYYSAILIGETETDYIFLADVPIAWDKFDDKSNDYETSYMRKYLLNNFKGFL